MFFSRLRLFSVIVFLLWSCHAAIGQEKVKSQRTPAKGETSQRSPAKPAIKNKSRSTTERLLLERRFLRREKARLLKVPKPNSEVVQYLRVISEQLLKIEQRLNEIHSYKLEREFALSG